MRAPRARHLVLVVGGVVLVGSGLVLTQRPPRADAPDLGTPVAAAPVAASATPPAPVVVPRAPAAPATLGLPGDPDPVPLVPVGVLPSGALQLPERPSVLGWYAAGATPGDPAGTAVIAGHVDSAVYGAGPLKRLLDISLGDVVRVTDATGRTHAYAVASRTSYRKTTGLPPELFGTDGPPRLALITCGGAFDERTGSYADNVVVVATPLG